MAADPDTSAPGPRGLARGGKRLRFAFRLAFNCIKMADSRRDRRRFDRARGGPAPPPNSLAPTPIVGALKGFCT